MLFFQGSAHPKNQEVIICPYGPVWA